MGNELTDKAFWANYWESKKDVAFTVPAKYTFHKLLQQVVSKNKTTSAIELGGFPGYYAIFLHKYLGLQTTIFDFYIHKPVLKQVLEANQLNESDVDIIEGDLFDQQPKEQYDLVLSCGLIEHFNDTKDIIARHLPFLKPQGTLFSKSLSENFNFVGDEVTSLKFFKETPGFLNRMSLLTSAPTIFQTDSKVSPSCSVTGRRCAGRAGARRPRHARTP